MCGLFRQHLQRRVNQRKDRCCFIVCVGKRRMSNLSFLGIVTDISRLRPDQRMTEELPSRANSQVEGLFETNSRTEVPAGANPRSTHQTHTGREIWKNTLSLGPSEKVLTERCVRFIRLEWYRTVDIVTAGAPWDPLQTFSSLIRTDNFYGSRG